MRRIAYGCVWFALAPLIAGCGGFGDAADLIVADSPPPINSPPLSPRQGVRVTYLGTNGYLLQSADATVLVDPYFSRVDLNTVTWDLPIDPDAERIDAAMAHIPGRVDLILVTHAHTDHLMDVPVVALRTGAIVVASPTACFLCQGCGVEPRRLRPAGWGDRVSAGPVVVRVLRAVHPGIFGDQPPFPGTLDSVPPRPTKSSDWICGTPLAFLIEMGGRRIYIDSGGTPDALPPAELAPVDLAILGVALPPSRQRFIAAVQRLKPRFIVPSHQDDFFRPLSDGFWFGRLTDFPAVRRAYKQADPPGRLILLDYFKPWTLE